MKKTFIGIGLALGIATGAALAADLPRGPEAYAPYSAAPFAGYSWAGPYLGVNIGYQWGHTTNNPTEPSGMMGGIQGGFNWQVGQFVFGGETDLQLSAAEEVFALWKFANPWFGTLRGRAGFAMNNVLIYGTAGLAYGSVRAETALMTESKTTAGWTAGVGAEVGLTPQWSARIEYLYVDLGDNRYSLTGVNNGLESNILRFGVNYRF